MDTKIIGVVYIQLLRDMIKKLMIWKFKDGGHAINDIKKRQSINRTHFTSIK